MIISDLHKYNCTSMHIINIEGREEEKEGGRRIRRRERGRGRGMEGEKKGGGGRKKDKKFTFYLSILNLKASPSYNRV